MFCLPPMEDRGVLAGAWYGGLCMWSIMHDPVQESTVPWLEPLFSLAAQDAAADWCW